MAELGRSPSLGPDRARAAAGRSCEDVDFTAPAGAITVLLGPNGAGKSTAAQGGRWASCPTRADSPGRPGRRHRWIRARPGPPVQPTCPSTRRWRRRCPCARWSSRDVSPTAAAALLARPHAGRRRRGRGGHGEDRRDGAGRPVVHHALLRRTAAGAAGPRPGHRGPAAAARRADRGPGRRPRPGSVRGAARPMARAGPPWWWCCTSCRRRPPSPSTPCCWRRAAAFGRAPRPR